LAVSLSKRVQKVKPSPTLAVTARAAKLKAEGKDIIGLGAGEPDFDTPVHIADAGVDAIRKGITRYTNVDGTPELKDAIIAKFKRDNGLTYERNQILVSSGAKQTCFNVCAALLDPGDECVIPAPYWVSYPDMALLADGVPVSVYAGPEQGYKITPAQLATASTLNAEFGLGLEFIEANAEDVPLPDASFDLAFSEYGASIWCDPYLWIPEAARLLRPGGELIFLRSSTLSSIRALSW